MFFGMLESLWHLNNRARSMETAAQGILTRDEMESRRLLAAEDLQRGLTQSHVARKFGVSRTTASRWNRALSGKGVEALRKRRAPGRPNRLNPEQLRGVAEIYRTGSRTAGFDTGPLDHRAFRGGDLRALRRALRSRSRGPHHAPARFARAHPAAQAGAGGALRVAVLAERASGAAGSLVHRGVGVRRIGERRHRVTIGVSTGVRSRGLR